MRTMMIFNFHGIETLRKNENIKLHSIGTFGYGGIEHNSELNREHL